MFECIYCGVELNMMLNLNRHVRYTMTRYVRYTMTRFRFGVRGIRKFIMWMN